MGRGDEAGVPAAGGYSALPGAPGDDLGEQRVFNYNRREPKDRAWTYAFVVTMLVLLTGGVAVGRGVNKRYAELTTDEYLADYAHCPATAPGGRGLLEDGEDEDGGPFSLHKFTHAVWPWLAVTLLGSLALGLGYVKMFEKHPMGMMITGAIMQVALLVIMGIAMFATNPYIGITFLLVAGVAVCIHMSTKRHFELCAQLFHVATKGLRANPSILLMVIVLWVALGVVAFVAVALLSMAGMNGSVVTNHNIKVDPQGQYCTDNNGANVPCCVWQIKGLAALYALFAVLACLWTFSIIIELRVFTIAGTITQWYFQPPGTSTEGTLKRSLGHAFGASFGSIVFGGMVLTILQILRFLLRMATNNRSRNMLLMCICMVIRAILMAILDIIEFLTRFATMWCAVKGDGFVESGRRATDMLKRNFMDTTFVWWFPSWVLLGINLVFSLAWAGIMLLVAVTGVAPDLKEYALAFFITSFITAYLVLSLTASILLNLVETVYFCYAIDKDNRVVSNDEVHGVFQKLPVKVGVLVEQPEGNVMYAAPQGQAPPPALPTV